MAKLSSKGNKWIHRGLFIAGLGLVIIGLTLSVIYNIILAPSTKQQFFIKTAPEFPVFGQQIDIDCNLYEPKTEYNFYGEQRPAIVLVHGFISSKVYFQGLAHELTKRGFVCLTITANGHGASGGAFTPTWENVTLSAVKYLRDYSTMLKIDPNRIGLMGHSMGSFSITIASILDQELGNYWVNATIGMGGPYLNITRGFGEGFAYLLDNPLIYPNVWFDPNVAIENVIIEGRTNLTCPYNYLNIIGNQDEFFSVNSAYELIYGMSTPAFWASFGISNQAQIITSQTYGEFNGTARRLVVIPGLGHALEGQHDTTVKETIDWFEEAMKLKNETNYSGSLDPNSISVDGYSLSGMLALIGGLILLVPLVFYFGDWLKPDIMIPKNAINMDKKDKRLMFLIYSVAFIGISFLVPLIISGSNLMTRIPTDFLASNLFTFPLLIQGLLMIPVIILVMWYEKRKYNMELSDFGLPKKVKPYLKAGFYGFLLFITLYVILNLASSWTMHNLFIWRFAGFLELFLYIFIGMLIFEVLFRGMIQNKLYKISDDSGLLPARWIEILKAALISGVTEGIAMGIIGTGLLAAGGFDVFSSNMAGMIPEDMGITLGWLPPMFILLPLIFISIEIGAAIIKAGLYRKINRNILASSIFISLVLAWLLSVLVPATNPYAPRFAFMT